MLVFCMDGAFFDCTKVVAVMKKPDKKKNNKANRMGEKVNEEEGKSL